jgi:ATP-dependent protease ClpP protease subunit
MSSDEDGDPPTFMFKGRVAVHDTGPTAPLGITFYGAVDDETTAAFEDALRHIEARCAPGTTVPVFISSTGGDLYCGLKICDLMRASPLRLVTVAVGACMSAAALIFSFGAERYVGEHATIMIHGVRVDVFDGKLKDVEIEAIEMRRLNTKMWRLMSVNCGKASEFFEQRFGQGNVDCYVTPETALEIGLGTAIGVPRLVAHVSREVRLEIPATTKVGDG